MKKFSWLLIICMVFITATVFMAELTQDVIKIDTPKKKTKTVETEVVFNHKKHAEEHATTCDACHPAIKEAVNAPENVKKIVHDTCKTCHAKDKPGKSFKCSLCHVVKVDAAAAKALDAK